MLQRALTIGYGRAARLVDFMAEDGYVGPYNGSKAREVLLTPTAWEAIKAGGSSTPTTSPAQPDSRDDKPASVAENILQEILEESNSEPASPMEEPKVSQPLKALPKESSIRSVAVSASTSPALADAEEELDGHEEAYEEEEVDVEGELEAYMDDDSGSEEYEDADGDEEDDEYEDEDADDDEEYEYVDEEYDEDEYEDVE
jgi:S-DNA-T family DNA segregation ATPase FtsK/SpoIIIE